MSTNENRFVAVDSLQTLPDAWLHDAYERAGRLQLDLDFILLLYFEIMRRGNELGLKQSIRFDSG
jgi:hypothetical protein